MKCSDLQTDLSLFADGSLSEAESLSIKSHLESCPLCRQRYAEYREMRSVFGRFERPTLSPAVKATISREVIAELRAGRSAWLPFGPDVREFVSRRLIPYSAGAFASILICGAFLSMMFVNLFHQSTSTAKESPLVAANHNPLRNENDISTTDFVRSRLGLGTESPSINPNGALVALTKTFVHGGMKSDEVVVVADVYSDGLAQIAEVVEPSRDRKVVGELEKALDTGPERSPFVPASMEERPESVRVVLKFQSVDVHAARRGRRQ
jgi:hypothetical protein